MAKRWRTGKMLHVEHNYLKTKTKIQKDCQKTKKKARKKLTKSSKKCGKRRRKTQARRQKAYTVESCGLLPGRCLQAPCETQK